MNMRDIKSLQETRTDVQPFLYSRFRVNRRAFSGIKGKFVVWQLHLALALPPKVKTQHAGGVTRERRTEDGWTKGEAAAANG